MHMLHRTAFIPLLLSSLATAAELRVPADHPTIQEAIQAASDGDVVDIAAGTYRERIDTEGKAVTLRGAGEPSETVIDGTGTGRDSALTCRSNESARTRIINLTFTGGLGQMNMGRGEIMGGGILIVDASPVFIGCVIRDNYSRYGSGGGIAITGGNPCFLDCLVERNASDHIGGGLLAKETGAIFAHCRLHSNQSPSGAGAYLWRDSMVTFEECEFIDNVATAYGGGLFSWGSSPILNDCLFRGNTAAGGAAICNLAGAPILMETRLDADQDIKHSQASPSLTASASPPASDAP